MIADLILTGFRGFGSFELRQLGRINLLVGANNCGKTSILEAVQFAASHGDPLALGRVSTRRGERVSNVGPISTVVSGEADVCHLFHGHKLALGANFKIVARTETALETLTVSVSELSRQRERLEDEPDRGMDAEEMIPDPNWELDVNWDGVPAQRVQLPLSALGGVPFAALRRKPRADASGSARLKFISSAGLMVSDVIGMFEEIVLTPEEDILIQAMNIVEPTIERLASVTSDFRRNFAADRGGIMVKQRSFDQRIPIGSMGDGMWRMLGLALSLVSAESGTLLVDEIDTGLHFTVMERLWALVNEVSHRLNVQVFATTHSRDAYESLAAICRNSVSEGSEVTIQRIDRCKAKSVPFTEQEIIASANRGIEVR